MDPSNNLSSRLCLHIPKLWPNGLGLWRANSHFQRRRDAVDVLSAVGKALHAAIVDRSGYFSDILLREILRRRSGTRHRHKLYHKWSCEHRAFESRSSIRLLLCDGLWVYCLLFDGYFVLLVV